MVSWRKILGRRSQADTVEALRRRLERFRALVDANNEVLELIADAGEKLGGEYIFDRQYLSTLAAQVKAAGRGVVFNLNAITGNRYPELGRTLQRLEAQLEAALESRVIVPSSELVLPLQRLDCTLAGAAGEKMARLGEIRARLSCCVPEGFVISAHACILFLEGIGLSESALDVMSADASSMDETAAVLRRRVLEAKVPREVAHAVQRAMANLKRRSGKQRFAVRSSAIGEDGELSYAGQYETLLNVPADGVLDAYRQVVASLFRPQVIRYRQAHELPPLRASMAVGCMAMVPARASGVAYTLDPVHPEREVLLVTAARGLGRTVVDGSGPADRYELSRQPPHAVLARNMPDEEEMLVAAPEEGVERVAVPEGERGAPVLSEEELRTIAGTALRIERYAKRTQDIEWAVDAQGHVIILQARPLRLQRVAPSSAELSSSLASHRTLVAGQGTIACRGIGCGRVRVVHDDDDLDEVPDETVLVARTSMPRMAAAMVHASAVITDVGTPTGHLAAVARELRVPMIVDAGNATQLLESGEEVTVDAEENVIYAGRVEELLRDQLLRSSSFEDAFEFRTLRRMLKSVAPLNLRDPQASGFRAASCATYHDVTRFAHEKAVAELTEGFDIRPSHKSRYVRRLDLELPLDLILIDLGGGLAPDAEAPRVRRDRVTSAPLVALLEGVTTEGAWARGPADMDLDGFMSSAAGSSALTGPLASAPQPNLAIISDAYLNLSLRLGYHFNVIDSYLSETRNDNYIYFRFAGGVTELARRSRRAALLQRILERYDFLVDCKGDLVVARLRKLTREDALERMRMLGRLVAFTRQLDIYLRSDAVVEHCADSFLKGRYDVFGG